MSSNDSYRDRFQQREAADEYDVQVYREGTVSDVLWRLEQPHLRDVVAELRKDHARIDYLDFACGTGRIVSYVSELVDSATGVDISSAMLERAKAKAPRAKFECRDVTRDARRPERRYDLVTSFRFLTNAEPELRQTALRWLAGSLRGPKSVCAINIHANPISYKAIAAPYHWLKAKISGKPTLNNLTRRQTLRELHAAGLEVVRIAGMGFVSEKLFKALPDAWVMGCEKLLGRWAFTQYFGVNQLFICRLAPTASEGKASSAKSKTERAA